jgi:hypothetical protein
MTELHPLKIKQACNVLEKAGLHREAEFLKGFIIKYDVIKNNNKVKRGNPIQSRKQTTVL